MALNSYSLIAGYNGTPANIEGISVTGGEDLRPFYSRLQSACYFFVQTETPYTKAYLRTASGGAAQSGYPVFTWKFPLIGVTSYKYLLETYGQDSSVRGKVTVGARSSEFDVYDDYNADMFLDAVTMPVYRRGSAFYFRDVTARFVVKGTA